MADLQSKLRAKTLTLRSIVAPFIIVGSLGAALDISVLTWLLQGGIDPAAGRFVSITVAAIFVWICNRTYTFGASSRTKLAEIVRYGVGVTFISLLNWALFIAISNIFPLQLPPQLYAACSIAICAVLSYAYQRYVVFR